MVSIWNTGTSRSWSGIMSVASTSRKSSLAAGKAQSRERVAADGREQDVRDRDRHGEEGAVRRKRAKLNRVDTSRYARRLGLSGIRSKPATLSGSDFSDVDTLQKNGTKKSSATPTSSV